MTKVVDKVEFLFSIANIAIDKNGNVYYYLHNGYTYEYIKSTGELKYLYTQFSQNASLGIK